MSDFVVNYFVWLGWMRGGRRCTRERRKIKESRPAEIEGETAELEKPRRLDRLCGTLGCFQTWCAEQDLAIDFKRSTKTELNQALRQF